MTVLVLGLSPIPSPESCFLLASGEEEEVLGLGLRTRCQMTGHRSTRTRASVVRALLALSVVALTAACAANPAPAPTPPPTSPTTPPAVTPTVPPGASARGNLAPVPDVDGPLAIDVVYPREGVSIGVRDSTFIFGNIGSGRAQLRINGAAIAVLPNGTFLAFLPVPQDGVYRLEAMRGAEVVRGERRIRVPTDVPSGPRSVIVE